MAAKKGGLDLHEMEEKWQKNWDKGKIYAFNPKSKKPVFSIDTPPPTVSGKMHLGHAFSYAQQDFSARFRRMKGFEVFYPFGTDDNGLATIRLVEKEKGVKGTRMSRKEFVKIALDVLKVAGPKYVENWKRIGMSCDWSIYYTTINDHCQKISQKSFLDLYNEKRIYRKRTPFLWCPDCQTSIAQVEMKDRECESNFVYMKFDTSIGEQITIATTRPELLPACIMVHVHPDDKRYKKFIGAKAKIPFFDREVDIMANGDVDPEFGSGAVYHCTFGDMDDVEWLEKYKIPAIEIMSKDGRLNEKAGKYEGMKSAQARKAIVEDLETEGRIEKIEKIRHVVNTHERCGTDIEILMTEQWFIKYLDLKNKFLKAGKEMNWHPAYMRSRYDNWIKGLKWDWNISRQRRFGIPIPVWFCEDCGEKILPDEKDLPVDPSEEKAKKKCKCGSNNLKGDPDVLDTWATSSLTPQITAGLFPKIYGKLYPMSLRPQAHDIITFWLFNTVVKSQLHSNVNPWKDIMISGWALDPKGKKMSKSLGNVIEPSEMIGKYSADILRYWAGLKTLGEDAPFKEQEMVSGRKLTVKLYNAGRFVSSLLKDYKGGKGNLNPEDKWILSRLNSMKKEATEAFEGYDFSKALNPTRNFFWLEFADYYIEMVKHRVYNEKGATREAAQFVLLNVYMDVLKMFAPFMPHITEEIYQTQFKKYAKKKSIHLEEWPESEKKLIDRNYEEIGEIAREIIGSTRKQKSEKQMPMNAEVGKIEVFVADAKTEKMVKEISGVIGNTMNVKEISIGQGKAPESAIPINEKISVLVSM